MCAATTGGLSLEGIDVAKESVIQGTVTRDGEPVGGAYVRLLDASGEFTAEVPTSATGAFRDDVVAAIGTDNLVDVRSPDEYAGRLLAPAHLPQEQSQRPGHVPTAVSVPWSKAANDDGTFRSDDELTALYAGAGLDLSKDTIAYCRIGERSAHTWFVLHELLGQSSVRNYDGSWTEYGSLVGVPVQLGDAPGGPEGGAA
jgi:thiosulfate/3-mercaptopyruvate sulfurtransferase